MSRTIVFDKPNEKKHSHHLFFHLLTVSTYPKEENLKMSKNEILAYTNQQICNIIRKIRRKKDRSEEEQTKLELLLAEADRRNLSVTEE